VDESRNNAFTAFFAVGEGWHNNHHRYQRAARNGFYWWEYDLTWYTIRAMSLLGLVWDIQAVPERIYTEARAAKARRPASAVPSVVDAAPMLELAEEPE
jgi:stearoyl-CoA desaturase (delta-9 desaturase)